MNLIYIWLKNSQRQYKSLFLIMLFFSSSVLVISFVAEYNSKIIISDSELEDSSDIIVNVNTKSDDYYETVYRNSSYLKIKDIVESNSKLIIKQIEHVETLSAIMQEQRPNNSMEALYDQRELLSNVYVVDEIVWSSINFINKSDTFVLYSNKDDNIRMINDTIFLAVADNFRINFTSKISEKTLWFNTEELIENIGFKSSSESIVIIKKEFFDEQLFSITEPTSYELNVYWILSFDYSNFDFSTIELQDQIAAKINNLIFINLLSDKIFYNIEIEFLYLEKLKNFEVLIFSNIQFIVIILNLIILVIASFLKAKYDIFYEDSRIFLDKIKNLRNNKINLSNFDPFLFLSVCSITVLIPLLVFGLFIKIINSVELSIIVSINLFIISFFLLLLNIAFLIISTKRNVELYKIVILYFFLQLLIFLISSQDINFVFLGFDLIGLFNFMIFNHLIYNALRLVLSIFNKYLVDSKNILINKYPTRYLLYISANKKYLTSPSLFLILLIILITGSVFVTQQSYEVQIIKYEIGSNYLIEGFDSMNTTVNWIENTNISKYSIKAEALLDVKLNGISTRIAILGIDIMTFQDNHYFNQYTQNSILKINRTINTLASLKVNRLNLGMDLNKPIFFENNNNMNYTGSISSDFNYWPNFVPKNYKFGKTDLYLISSFKQFNKIINSSTNLYRLEYKIATNDDLNQLELARKLNHNSGLSYTDLEDEISNNQILYVINLNYPIFKILFFIFIILFFGILRNDFFDKLANVKEILWEEGHSKFKLNLYLNQVFGIQVFLIQIMSISCLVIYNTLATLVYFPTFNKDFIQINYDYQFISSSLIILNTFLIVTTIKAKYNFLSFLSKSNLKKKLRRNKYK